MPQALKRWSLTLAIALTFGLRALNAQAADESQGAEGQSTQEQIQDQQPDLEMLEFIGEWETDDGSWVDPLALQQTLQASSQQNSAVNEDTKDESR